MSSLRGWKGPLLLLQWAALVLFLDQLSGCHGFLEYLKMTNITERDINEGELLEIKCKRNHFSDLFYPKGEKGYITTSKIEDYYFLEDGWIIFRRPSAVFGDTGLYCCLEETEEEDDKPSKCEYIYVKSSRSAFVQNPDNCSQHQVRYEETAILPCRPTSPKSDVILMTRDGLVPESMVTNRTTFDPKFGFIIEKSEFTDSGNYTCEINQDGVSQKMCVSLLINKKEQKKPTVEIDSSELVVAGSTLNVKCTVEIEIGNPYNISWDVPRKSSSRKIFNPVEENKGLSKLVTSKLIIHNVTYEDQGYYTCQIESSFSEHESSNVHIEIHDPNNTYINLTFLHVWTYYGDDYDSAILRAYVDAYPRPTLKWFHPLGNEIPPENVTITSNGTFARYHRGPMPYHALISSITINISNRKDIGNYTLRANNGHEVKDLNFTVEFEELQTTVPEDHKTFHSINENAKFSCFASSRFELDISWVYEQCPTYHLKNGCKNTTLKAYKNTNMGAALPTIRMTSMIRVNLTSVGQIYCTACSRYGCKTVQQSPIIFIDGEQFDYPFGIIKPEGKIFKGDNVTLVCAAVNYNFIYVFWHRLEKGGVYGPVNQDKDTKFTHRSILQLNNVTEFHNALYTCEGRDLNYQPHYKNYFLEVQE